MGAPLKRVGTRIWEGKESDCDAIEATHLCSCQRFNIFKVGVKSLENVIIEKKYLNELYVS